MITTVQERRFNPILRILSLTVVIIFLTTSLAWASGVNVLSIKVPEKYGKVKERYKGTGTKTVIHIQDAHTSLEAQKNIAEILAHLNQTEDDSVRPVNAGKAPLLVGIEGAKGAFDTEALRRFPLQSAKEKVGEYFLRKGRLNGSEYQALVSHTPIDLYGIEDEKLYLKNYDDFIATTQQRDELLGQIDSIENALNELKRYLYADAVRQLDEAIIQYNHGTITFPEYCNVLIRHAAEVNVDFYDYINFSTLAETAAIEAKIDFEAVDKERDALCAALINVFNQEEKESFNAFVEQFFNKELSEKEFYQHLIFCADKHTISLQSSLNLQRYSEYLKLYARLDITRLILECRDIESVVFQKLARNDDEYMLITLSRNINLMRSFTELKAVNEDVEYFRAHRDDFKVARFVSFITRVAQEKNVSLELDKEAAVLIDELMPLVDRFYETAEARNSALINNLLAQMKTDDATGEVAALVAGGYHTKGLTEELKKRDISYLVVTPHIADTNVGIPYEDRMAHKLIPFDLIIASAFNTIAAESLFAPIRERMTLLPPGGLHELISQMPDGLINVREADALVKKEVSVKDLHLQQIIVSLVILGLIELIPGKQLNRQTVDEALGRLDTTLSEYKELLHELADSEVLAILEEIEFIADEKQLREELQGSGFSQEDIEKKLEEDSIVVRIANKLFVIDLATFQTNFEEGFTLGVTAEKRAAVGVSEEEAQAALAALKVRAEAKIKPYRITKGFIDALYTMVAPLPAEDLSVAKLPGVEEVTERTEPSPDKKKKSGVKLHNFPAAQGVLDVGMEWAAIAIPRFQQIYKRVKKNVFPTFIRWAEKKFGREEVVDEPVDVTDIQEFERFFLNAEAELTPLIKTLFSEDDLEKAKKSEERAQVDIRGMLRQVIATYEYKHGFWKMYFDQGIDAVITLAVQNAQDRFNQEALLHLYQEKGLKALFDVIIELPGIQSKINDRMGALEKVRFADVENLSTRIADIPVQLMQTATEAYAVRLGFSYDFLSRVYTHEKDKK
ncbi:MAG: hypothetical protein KKH94_00060, partial [Candidatus Omnitrophica bacterium]|nr:hypothetical protein [Candidatus Omnitrophota bacterium]